MHWFDLKNKPRPTTIQNKIKLKSMLLMQINPILLSNKVDQKVMCKELDQNRSKSWG